MNKLFAKLTKLYNRLLHLLEGYWRGPVFRRRLEELQVRLQREAEAVSKEMERKDLYIYELEQIKAQLIEQTIARWVAEYLQDSQYWLKLFRHVLSQPKGRALWIEAVFEQVDKLTEQERLDLFYRYLKSRGGEIKIEFTKPKVELPPTAPEQPQAQAG